jgi:hypothetical protein
MKYLIIASMFLSGCVTPISYTYKERCAFRDMKLEGIDSGGTTTSSYNYSYGNTTSYSSSENVRCGLPANAQDKEDIENTRAIATPKVYFNSSVHGKGLLNGLGYLFYIVPGFILLMVFESQKEKVIKETEMLAKAANSTK